MACLVSHFVNHLKGQSIKFLSSLLLLLTALCVVVQDAHALDASLPFLSKKPSFTLHLEGDERLKEELERALVAQRKHNQELRQFSKRNKVARYESQLLRALLQAKGYYDASLSFLLEADHIHYHIDAGSPYRVARLSLDLPDSITLPAELIRLKVGDILRAEAVLEDRSALRQYLATQHCLYEIDVDYQVDIAEKEKAAHLSYIVGSSPQAVFGKIHIQGNQTVDTSYLKDRLPMREGDCFQRNKIDETRIALIQTNLLTSVSADISEPVDGQVDLTLTTTERKHRTLSLGTGFQTDEGFGVFAGWEHRNLGGRAQRLQINTQIAENVQRFTTDLTLPHFKNERQALTIYGELGREDTEAFESESIQLGGELARQLSRHLRGTLGTELSLADVREDENKDNVALFSLLFNLAYDVRNDPLDPRSGWVASAQTRPYWDIKDSNTQFTKSTLASSVYFSLNSVPTKPTLALRAAMGVIDEGSRDAVPANIRFYVGGGGSVRGYPFQTLGPLTDKEPDGGLSFTELSAEARLRFGKSWGAVFFIDGGMAYEQQSPQLDEQLLWGAGMGLRYYTSFAPLRLDVALPLDKRDGIDDDFQLYISIGQAF